MTPITHPVVRGTGCFLKADEIVVELQRGVLVARLKGKPSSRHVIGYQDLYEVLYWRDAKAAVKELFNEKQRARKRGQR